MSDGTRHFEATTLEGAHPRLPLEIRLALVLNDPPEDWNYLLDGVGDLVRVLIEQAYGVRPGGFSGWHFGGTGYPANLTWTTWTTDHGPLIDRVLEDAQRDEDTGLLAWSRNVTARSSLLGDCTFSMAWEATPDDEEAPDDF